MKSAAAPGIPSGRTIRQWMIILQPKDCNKGNHFSALHRSKSLSEIDKLKLTVEKLQIENERLKKGYITKGVGARKVFVTLKDLNSK